VRRPLSLFSAIALLIVAACVDPMTTQPASIPEWDVKNVAGYAETVAGLPPDTVLAWDLRVEGGMARWRECATIDACDDVERERPASEVLGVEHVGHADGGLVDVVKLSLAPRPKYVVPITKAR
jgi:hypothetical protein